MSNLAQPFVMYCTAEKKERVQNSQSEKRRNSAIFRPTAKVKTVLESARREEQVEHKINEIRTRFRHANLVLTAHFFPFCPHFFPIFQKISVQDSHHGLLCQQGGGQIQIGDGNANVWPGFHNQ